MVVIHHANISRRPKQQPYLKHFLHAFFFVIIFRVLDYYPLHFTDETTEVRDAGNSEWEDMVNS